MRLFHGYDAATERQNRADYLNTARQRIAELEEILLADLAERTRKHDSGGDANSLRQEFGKRLEVQEEVPRPALHPQ